MLTQKTGLHVNGFRSKQLTHNAATSAPLARAEPRNSEAALDRATTDKPLDALLKAARRALSQREFAVAQSQLQKALDLAPGSPEAHTLRGLIHEALGQQHAAYHAYKTALQNDHGHGPALSLMRAYCDRFGLDFHNPRINPAAARLFLRPGR
jgi:tetratricopeptide (TPR) repeat protein